MSLKTLCWVIAAMLLASCTPQPSPPPSPTAPFIYLPTSTLKPTLAPAPLVTVAPLPTVGPTATPVVHVVQAGETLIGIAQRYGVTLEALETVNPGLNPQTLQPGTALVIPLEAGGGGSALLPAATPVPLTLGPVACFETPVASRWCFVEARNEGSAPVENVSALVTLIGAKGKAVMTDVAYSPLNLLAPGGAIPLAVLFPATGAQVMGAVALLQSADAAGEVEARYLPVTVNETGVEGTGAHRTVSGEVRLEGEIPARAVKLALVLYDRAGLICGYRELTLPEGLSPGESRPFQLGATAVAGRVESYRVLIEARP